VGGQVTLKRWFPPNGVGRGSPTKVGGDSTRSHRQTDNMVKKVKGKYVALSEKTGRKFGTYKTLAEAKRRPQQVEFFKHVGRDRSRRRA